MEFVVRDLEKEDFSKGFPNILGQLTTVGESSQETLLDRFDEIKSSPDYKVVVIEDPKCNKIIATASLLIERKFIRSCGKAGHIEDVVVDQTYRGKHLGQRVIEALLVAAKEAGCYKIILDCAEANAAFYEKCGLTRKEVQMSVLLCKNSYGLPETTASVLQDAVKELVPQVCETIQVQWR